LLTSPEKRNGLSVNSMGFRVFYHLHAFFTHPAPFSSDSPIPRLGYSKAMLTKIGSCLAGFSAEAVGVLPRLGRDRFLGVNMYIYALEAPADRRLLLI
jgi:hypothetical protein